MKTFFLFFFSFVSSLQLRERMGQSVSRYYGKAMADHFQEKRSDVVFLDNRSSIRFSFQNILAEKMKKGGSNGYNGGKKFKSHSMNVKFFDLRYGATRCNFFAPAYTPWSDAVEESDGIIYVIDHFRQREEGEFSLTYILENYKKPLILFGKKGELEEISEIEKFKKENDFFKIFSYDETPSTALVEEALEWLSTSIGIANASKWVEEEEREEEQQKQEEWNQSVCISLEEPNLPSECESTTDLPN